MHNLSMVIRRQTFEFWARDRRPVVAGPPGRSGQTVKVKRTFAPGPLEDVATRHRAVRVKLGPARFVGSTAVYEYDRSQVKVNKRRRA